MPMYEYKCSSCFRITTELLQYKKDSIIPEIIQCKFCGKESKKIISLTSNPIFNGKGFYSTDYKNKS